jgi:hypothetical protein
VIKIKYNQSDILVKKEIVIIEVEKKHKYDLLANLPNIQV